MSARKSHRNHRSDFFLVNREGWSIPSVYQPMTDHEPVSPHDGDARARVLAAVAPRIGQLRAQAALHPDAHVDVALVRETIALLQSLLPANAAADKQAQVDMANEHHARADRVLSTEGFRHANQIQIAMGSPLARAVERDRVIEVLDAWKRDDDQRRCIMSSGDDCQRCTLCWPAPPDEDEGPIELHKSFTGVDEDAARAAAAQAIEAGRA